MIITCTNLWLNQLGKIVSWTSCLQMSPRLCKSVILGMSDHDIVCADFLISSRKIKQSCRKIFLYKKDDFEKINEGLTNYADTITEELYRNSSVDELWLGFKDTLLSAMERHIPSKMVQQNVSQPWFKQSHKRTIRRKRRAYNKARRLFRSGIKKGP